MAHLLYPKREPTMLDVFDMNLDINFMFESKNIDKDIITLEKHITAFNSLVVVQDQIAAENFNFVDKGNYVLYNEYINTVTRNLGVKNVPVVTQEALSSLSGVALNHNIALEGFIGDMWKKIKEIFAKIYDSIKEFFKKYFTRLGRVKNKINNLIEVLQETTKDIQKSSLEQVPGGLAAKYPINGTIDSRTVAEVYNGIAILINSFEEIHKKAEVFANKDILDKDFVAGIIKLKEEIKNNETKVGANKEEQDKIGFKKHIPFTDDREKNKGLNKENDSLEKDAEKKTKEVNSKTGQVDDITSKESDLDSEEQKGAEAKKEFTDFLNTLETVFNKVKGKQLIKGKTITQVKVSEDSGIELDIDENKDTPNSIMLDDKESLIKLLKTVLEGIKEAEKLTSVYGKINDKIMDNLNKVDKLINDINKIPEESLGKYKKLLNNKVKVRLNLAKTFFNNYNKVSKNIFEMLMDTADGVVDYSVLSLKHFG